MMVIYDARDITGYGRRTLELSYTQLHMKQDTTSIPVYQYREKKTNPT